MDETNLKSLNADWNVAKTNYDLVCAQHPTQYDLIEEKHDILRSTRKTYKKACKDAKEMFIQSAIDRANNKKDAQGKWKAAEQLIAGFTGHHKKDSDFVNMIDKDGNVAKTLQENAHTVQQHLSEEVFGRTSKYDPNALESLPQLNENHDLGRIPSIAGLNTAIDRMDSFKPQETMASPAEAFKALDPTNRKIFHALLCKYWENDEFNSNDWHVTILKLLPKKGNQRLPKNWRPIALLDVLQKS
jgi:hypothetical protein